MNQVVLQAVLVEQLQQAAAPDLAGEEAARDVAGRVLAAVRAEPARDRVDVDADAQKISFAIVLLPFARLRTTLRAMCALCGVLLERALGRAGRRPPGARLPRAARSNRVLDHFGLRLDDWGGRVYVLRDRKGRSAVVADLGVALGRGRAARGPAARPARPGPRALRLADGKLPVALVTGFLGSGKTTLISRLLAAPGHGRDGGDRERARRGRDRPPPPAAGRRADRAADERLRVLLAPRRPRRRAARPARPARAGRDPAASRASSSRRPGSPTRRRSSTRCSPSPSSSTTSSSRASSRPSTRSTGCAAPESRQAGRRSRHARRHEDRPRRRPARRVERRLASLNPAAAVVRAVVRRRRAGSPLRRRRRDPRELAAVVRRARARPRRESRAVCLVLDEPLDWTAFGIWLTMLLQARGADSSG